MLYARLEKKAIDKIADNNHLRFDRLKLGLKAI